MTYTNTLKTHNLSLIVEVALLRHRPGFKYNMTELAFCNSTNRKVPKVQAQPSPTVTPGRLSKCSKHFFKISNSLNPGLLKCHSHCGILCCFVLPYWEMSASFIKVHCCFYCCNQSWIMDAYPSPLSILIIVLFLHISTNTILLSLSPHPPITQDVVYFRDSFSNLLFY